MKQTILVIFGTRPEAIKLAPLIIALKQNKQFSVNVCVTSQHTHLLQQMLDFFNIEIDFNLNIMSKNQSLSANYG